MREKGRAPFRVPHAGLRAARAAAILLFALCLVARSEENLPASEARVDPLAPPRLLAPITLLGMEPRLATEALAAAVEEASARLSVGGCPLLLAEFSDLQGRPLQSRLEESRLSIGEFVGTLRFVSGRGLAPCASRQILAFTRPGLRTITICTEQFAQTQKANPELAAAIVIHEVLHALGLGENPPSSLEITARVRRRCPAVRESRASAQ